MTPTPQHPRAATTRTRLAGAERRRQAPHGDAGQLAHGGPSLPHLPNHPHRHRRSEPVTATPPRPRCSGTTVCALTVAEFCAELGISRSTFYDWHAKKRAPKCVKLPNGELRIRRDEYERWLAACEETE